MINGPTNEFGDERRNRRFKFVTEHHGEQARLFRSVYNEAARPRSCIKAFCLECNSWEEFCICNCSTTECPLWRFRPFQGKYPKPDRPLPTAHEQPGPLPPILSLKELLEQQERDRADGVPEHLQPQQDGFC